MEAQYVGEPDVGDRVVSTAKVAGRKLEMTTECTAIESPGCFARDVRSNLQNLKDILESEA